jgi:hypothetical protein
MQEGLASECLIPEPSSIIPQNSDFVQPCDADAVKAILEVRTPLCLLLSSPLVAGRELSQTTVGVADGWIRL